VPTQEESVEACRALLKVAPNKINARLYLGSLLLRLKRFSDAEAAFKEAAENAAATPDEKAYALVCAGVSHFRNVVGEDTSRYPAAAAESEHYFQSAVDAQKANPDAIGNLAFAKALAQPRAVATLQKMYDEAMAAPTPPSPYAEQQLYALHGLILMQQGKVVDALADFERAQAMQPSGLPGLPSPQDNRRTAMLAAMVQSDISQAQRIELMSRVDREIGSYGKQEIEVINALGLARGMMKNDPDYAKTFFRQAREKFNFAISKDAKDGRAYVNQAALIEDRINELGKLLSVPVTGFNGETPVPNPWVDTATKVFPSGSDVQIVNDINTLLHDEDVLWDGYFNKADIKLEDKVNGKLRQLACLRRTFWLLPPDNPNRPPVATRCTTLAEEIVRLAPEDPRAHFAQGVNWLERGDQGKAFTALMAAKSKGMTSKVLARLLSDLGSKPEVTDARPWGSLRFGVRPLIRATLRGVNVAMLQSMSMKLDGRDVQPARVGSQVLYLAKDEELGDGKHKVELSATDGANPVELPAFFFFMNKKPPTWAVTVEGAEPLPAQPVWTIVLTDASGIDFTSLKMVIKKANGGFTRELVRDGHYRVTSQKLNIKAMDAVSTDTFKVSPGSDLPPGDYTLSIDVLDTAGNQLRDTSRAFSTK
jgi:tetratricopeptide (TPR) repeat protein